MAPAPPPDAAGHCPMHLPPSPLARRHLLLAGAALVLQPAARAATPACGRPATERQTEGPYFRRSSPQRDSLREDGIAGEPLTIEGRVLDADCRPVAGALLDVWQADADGRYDLQGFRLRGHLFADADGRYRLQTVVPGLYPGRTRHIHVKVQPPGGRVLTTQLYFPGEPGNRRDGLFSEALLLAPGEAGGATFDFRLG